MHEPFTLTDENNYSNEARAINNGIFMYKIKEIMPRRVKFNPDLAVSNYYTNGLDGDRVVDFCYGVFSKDRIVRQEGDFIFNIIKHPVDRIYDLYHYGKYEFRTINENGDRLNIMKKAFDRFKNMTLNDFIDAFLYANGEIKFQIFGVEFKLIDECVNLNNMIDYDFIGIDENLELSLAVLGKYIGIEIPYAGRITEKSSILKPSKYRYSELVDMMEKDIHYYTTARERLAHLGREYYSPIL